MQLHPGAGSGAVLQTWVCSACRGWAPSEKGSRCVCPSTETVESPTAMALHKNFPEPLPSCLSRGFPELAPHIAQEACPAQASEYTLLAAAAAGLLRSTVPGMSPCCRCHLFILALTKGNHASEKTLYWKGRNLWNVQKNGSTWFKSSRRWVHLKANNQRHKMPPPPQNNCLFLRVYCGRKS